MGIVFVLWINVRENRRGKQERLATLDTQDTGGRQLNQKPQHRKLKRWGTWTQQYMNGYCFHAEEIYVWGVFF